MSVEGKGHGAHVPGVPAGLKPSGLLRMVRNDL